MSELESWQAVRQAAAALGAAGRSCARVADLAVARATAEAAGLVPDVFHASHGSPARLLGAMRELAAIELPPLAADRRGWRELQAAAIAAGEQVAARRALHEWSAASQGSDGGRKGKGAYGTPPALAAELARATLGPLAGDRLPALCDPSAGHGALLIAGFDSLVAAGHEPARAAAALHGVELDPHAWELCTLMVWLAGAGAAGVGLVDLRARIVRGNALRWSFEDAGQASWATCFGTVFARGGFDAIVMNPPWESLRHRLDREAEQWAERAPTRERLSAVDAAGRNGLPPLYSRQGRGDRNLYKGFVELAPQLLRFGGRVGALVPAAFASDLGMQPSRELYLEQMSIEQWTSFENLGGYFPIDSRYKFGILVAERSASGTSRIRIRSLARNAAEVRARHVELTRAEVARLGGAATMIPELSNELELAVLRQAFEAGEPFFAPGGSFGQIGYRRELDLTLDRTAGRFRHLEECAGAGAAASGDGSWSLDGRRLVPLIEGRMVGPFEFFHKSWRGGSGRTARWQPNGASELPTCRPQFLAERLEDVRPRLAICDVTSATNTRTMLASWVPPWPCGNTAPVLVLDEHEASLALLAVLNSMTFDWILRRIVAGLHLNRFYLEATPLPRLASAERARLARYGAALTNRSPRVSSLAPADRGGLPAIALARCGTSAAEVEAAVARGYGLSADQLAYVLNGDPSERKGLWRYFAAAPEAVRVAEESLALLRAA